MSGVRRDRAPRGQPGDKRPRVISCLCVVRLDEACDARVSETDLQPFINNRDQNNLETHTAEKVLCVNGVVQDHF